MLVNVWHNHHPLPHGVDDISGDVMVGGRYHTHCFWWSLNVHMTIAWFKQLLNFVSDLIFSFLFLVLGFLSFHCFIQTAPRFWFLVMFSPFYFECGVSVLSCLVIVSGDHIMKFVQYIMYIISHLYVVNHSWKLDILKYVLNFQNFKISHFQKYGSSNIFLLYEYFESSLKKCFF